MQRPIAFNKTRYWFATAGFAFAGGLAGIASALSRPHAEINGAHLEAMAEYFLVMPLICISVMTRFLRIRLQTAIPAMCIQLLVVWVANLAGHVIGSRNQYLIDDFFGVTLVFALGSMLVLSLLLAGIRKLWPPNVDPTRCFGCGYSLIGLKDWNCPECGKAFTLEGQGLSAQDLEATS